MVAQQAEFSELVRQQQLREVSMPVTKKKSPATSSKSKLKTNMAVKKKAGKKKKK
jgi:hypothetical protein